MSLWIAHLANLNFFKVYDTGKKGRAEKRDEVD